MSNAIKKLSELDFEGKEWISELRNKLCQNGILSEGDIQLAFDKIHSINILPTIMVDEVEAVENNSNRSLYQLRENKNLGGLFDDNLLEFSPQITVIYGKNGSGKSTYYRALKDAFLENQNIQGNIYNPSSVLPSAKIEFRNKDKHLKWQKSGTSENFEDNSQVLDWTSGMNFESLVKFCDSDILDSALSKKETGWSIDRYKFEYYDKFRNAIEAVEVKNNAKLFQLRTEYETDTNTILLGLKSKTDGSIHHSLSELNSDKSRLILKLKELTALVVSDEELASKVELTKQSVLSVQDLTLRINAIQTRISGLQNVQNFCSESTAVFAGLKGIREKVDRALELKESIDFSQFDKYNLLFDPSKNKDAYIGLIKKIAEVALLYGEENYPEGIEKCFYCNQSVEGDNKSIITGVHSVIESEFNKELELLQSEISTFFKRIERHISTELSEVHILEIGDVFDIATETKLDISELIQSVKLNAELSIIKLELDQLKVERIDVQSIWIKSELLFYLIKSEVEALEFDLEKQKLDLDRVEKIKRIALDSLNRIEDKEFCILQKELITKTAKALELHKKYIVSDSMFSGYKTKISRDKGRVENELVGVNYIQEFDDNLNFFGLAKRDSIKRSFSNPGGTSNVDGKIESNGNSFSVSSILSEGEAKVFSFCDWLTELKFDDNEILVFDDPITSLDQVNIYKVVEKLVDLSAKYQVIVFTHNFEFYHRLLQKSLGGKALDATTCEICNDGPDQQKCKGLLNSGNIHKCGSYYLIEYITQPGHVKDEVIFLSLNWEQRLEILRANLIAGDKSEADKHLRTTINNFFERYVLGDIKRKVYKNNDLIKEWRSLRTIDDTDYNALMDVHSIVSSEGSLHESSPEVRTELDVRGYIVEFNKTVRAINNVRGLSQTIAEIPQ